MRLWLFILFLVLIFVPPVASAQTTQTSSSASASRPDRQQAPADRLVSLKTRADKEIDRRISSLTKLITKINELKRLSSDQKSSLVTQVQTEITSLQTLKSKIDADTDLETLKTDTKAIVESYRIYALFMPKIQILAASDALTLAADKISSVAAKLETRAPETALTTLSDIQSKIADAKLQAQNAQDAVMPLTPSGYPENKTTLQAARAMIVVGRKDLEAVRQLIQPLTGRRAKNATPSSFTQ